jgi:hypothetical protein
MMYLIELVASNLNVEKHLNENLKFIIEHSTDDHFYERFHNSVNILLLQKITWKFDILQ